MQLISPERIFRGDNAWLKALPQIKYLCKSPLLLGRSNPTKTIRQQIYKDLLDEIIVFRQLTKSEVKDIAEIMLKEVFSRLNEKGIKLDVTDAFKERLVEEGYNPSYGARPLRRAVMRLLEDSLAEEVLSGRIKDGDKALVDIDENKKVTVNISSEESSQELAGANF